MSHCQQRCKRQLGRVIRFFYQFVTGTLSQDSTAGLPVGTGHGAMERTSLHNDSLLYASLIAILLLISYWFTTRCFKIISGIEGSCGSIGDIPHVVSSILGAAPGGVTSLGTLVR
ncbi:hypothetical protein TURU_131147 [Turdus rufiventris]|nr:hypothetical protein TURU_131147 [Turdus rufiventris]